jgi:hypothetical protein
MDSNALYNRIIETGETWADLDAAASLLEETKKSVLAKLMLEADATSAAAKEMYALADETYVAHVRQMVKTREAANKAKVRWDSARIYADLRRSEEATRRAEANIR